MMGMTSSHVGDARDRAVQGLGFLMHQRPEDTAEHWGTAAGEDTVGKEEGIW